MSNKQSNKTSQNTKKDEELRKLVGISERELMMEFRTSQKGLSNADAAKRLHENGPNVVSAQKPTPAIIMFLKSFEDPFVYVLVLLMIISALTRDFEAVIVMAVMILASVMISFIQEYRSQIASQNLKELIENTAAVTREGQTKEIPMDEIVPGDIVTLATGDMIPADAVLIWTKDLFVNQSSLTGESMPVEKFVDAGIDKSKKDISALDMKDLVFMGTDILSGQGKAIILKTGENTFFGDIAKNATVNRGKTAFDQGLTKVSKFLLRMVAILFPIVFLINGITKGQWTDAFFFAIAVVVGLTPEMLPVIVTSNLAKGALNLSKHKVIVKELSSIQNLGGMDVLCTDKTGTITEDRVVLVQHLNPFGETDDEVLDMTYLNSYYQTGWKNLMDIAVINFYKEKKRKIPFKKITKLDEIPFDFSRRRLTVVINADDHQLMITKGAVEEMKDICTHAKINGKIEVLTPDLQQKMHTINVRMNEQGMRVLAVAVKKDVHSDPTYSTNDEKGMTLIGFMGFLDPAKKSATTAIRSLQEHGINVKVLTGDNDIVAKKVCKDVGIEVAHVLLGTQIEQMTDQQLKTEVEQTNLFAKLNPMQKSKIIATLQENHHTVGFMGDGINDAPALRKADVGISVDTAADITKDASSIILLEKSLDVLADGVSRGREVFSNMMKYIKITISSNFGNVFSILVASAFLPFLPMMSLQLLIQNLIYDMAQLSIPWDHVDKNELMHPVRWNTKELAQFTICIGPVSSIFDIITYLVMWFVFHANSVATQHLFQTGWFVVGLTSQVLVVHILRTKKIPFIQSFASWQVTLTSFLAILLGLLIVLTPIRKAIGFVKLPANYWLWLIIIVGAYLITVELAKRFYIHLTKKWI